MPEAKIIKLHNPSGNPVYIMSDKIEVFINHSVNTTKAKIRIAGIWSDVMEPAEEILALIEGKKTKRTMAKKFIKPTVAEIKAYCDHKRTSVDPQLFYDHYESKGWMIGKNKMIDWKAAVGTWIRGRRENGNGGRGSAQSFREGQEESFNDISERIQM